MVRKKKSLPKSPKYPSKQSHDGLFIAQLCIAAVIFFSISFVHLMGPFGRLVQMTAIRLFGDALPLLPWLLVVASVALLGNAQRPIRRYCIELGLFLLFFLSFIDSLFVNKLVSAHGEELWTLSGNLIYFGSKIFGGFGVRLLCFSLSVTFGVMLFRVSVSTVMEWVRMGLNPLKNKQLRVAVKHALFYTKQSKKVRKKMGLQIKKKKDDMVLKHLSEPKLPNRKIEVKNAQDIDVNVAPMPIQRQESNGHYILPPLDLLAKPRQSNAKQMETDMREKSHVLEMALESFNVRATVVHITIGPSVSRFELQPGEGVKISKITNLSQDIALKLAVPTVRIEAPIPGKALIGIEVPNAHIAPLNLRTIIDPKTFFDARYPLACILGQRITGEGVAMNLNKMPHILVAGSTGSGKSVCVNAIIVSILMKATPDEVKFLMIDPKKVELSLYADIPHLLAPVVTNPHRAAATLKQWALVEMERRYELFTTHGVKDLAGFNALAKASDDAALAPIPYIVVVIDEFADLMMVASQEVENTICRLAQMARATGIHLVIATQRPSVNVVTGLIKANIPSRISFAVQSQIDSRTVLDIAGAEKLLGRGDMLYMPTGSVKPDRVQGVFVSEKEVNDVVNFIKNQAPPDYENDIMAVEVDEPSDDNTEPASDKDELFEQAKAMIQSTQYASTSYLQRKLRIGYNRAARLMDELEEAGVISGYDGESKTRTILPG
jgi:S-DNA-T family DNA segregation ATPase FtsK/SpoIIIE